MPKTFCYRVNRLGRCRRHRFGLHRGRKVDGKLEGVIENARTTANTAIKVGLHEIIHETKLTKSMSAAKSYRFDVHLKAY